MFETGLVQGLLCSVLIVFCTTAALDGGESSPIEHTLWDELLQNHVSEDGLVDYRGFMSDSAKLNQYLNVLSQNHPNDSWSESEQLAFWINAYNAFTVKLILKHYPVSSIKDIKRGIPFVNTVWDIKFIEIGDRTYDLNKIEHGIIRKHFDEPRIHFAINCASISCPTLAGYAYIAMDLDTQLDQAAFAFINDPIRNQIQSGEVKLSKIFSWFSGDFKKSAPSIREFVNRYAKTKIPASADIDYLDYDWSLNEVKP